MMETAGKSPTRLIRLKEVQQRVALKQTAIYDRMRRGDFPKPIKLSEKCAAWVESEVEEWIRQQANRRAA